jgi:hypothetical protein
MIFGNMSHRTVKINLDQYDVNLASFLQMEKSQQRSVVKFFFLKGLGAEGIHRELTTILGSTAYSLGQVREWRARFATGKLSYQEEFRPGHSSHVLGKVLSDFLKEFPFASAGIIAQHFGQPNHTIKKILQQELGLRRFSRSCVPHSLSEGQEIDRTAMTNDPLNVLHHQTDYSFSRIVTSDEFWFLC